LRPGLGDELADLSFEVVCLGLERLDALGGVPQRADGGAVFDVAGRAVTQFRTMRDLGIACSAA
jgi:hypothetical protein